MRQQAASRRAGNKKPQRKTTGELTLFHSPVEHRQRPLLNRVSLLHKGGCPICNSGCGDPIVDRVLRPPGKLPVPVALNAGSPTLFGVTIHDFSGKVKRIWKKVGGKDGAVLSPDKLGFIAQARQRPKASPLGKLAKFSDF